MKRKVMCFMALNPTFFRDILAFFCHSVIFLIFYPTNKLSSQLQDILGSEKGSEKMLSRHKFLYWQTSLLCIVVEQAGGVIVINESVCSKCLFSLTNEYQDILVASKSNTNFPNEYLCLIIFEYLCQVKQLENLN